MLAIGACLVDDPEIGFYSELRPLSMEATPDAMAVNGLSMDALAESATPPARAVADFDTWIARQVPEGKPLFAGFNAAFDWMFVNDYFHRYLGRNPFGHAALDMKSLYMGLTGAAWRETSFRNVARRYGLGERLTHNALDDARDQAALLRRMLREANER
ncbi:MAG: exonuclease domain-containing protein [Chloroflexota bacterium]|nr:exonuclease domain-containing protein [Chloroflexota bacterium]